ncbi:hypothetical protein HMPREF9148_02445 [Prevotella sp. F0091]|nr:hypothetical protein HMPREF9148_02445 [Prevotella sp. F0091]
MNRKRTLSGLNPCSNGRYSRSKREMTVRRVLSCLNPCSNGRYSRSSW